MSVETLYSAKSDTGLKRRHNEDSFVADQMLGLYAVCDGMGGSNAGEVASRLAADTILDYMKSSLHCVQEDSTTAYDPNLSPSTNQLLRAIHKANTAIHQASWANPKHAGMGTTVVAAHFSEGMLSVAHVGDSRLYLIRRGVMKALTTDHSWVAEQVARGYLTEKEAEQSPRRNIVTRALGIESTVEVDASEIPTQNGDILLFCSDGLTRGVSEEDILRTLELNRDLNEKTEQLVTMANQAGGDDNVTVLLVAVQRGMTDRLWDRIRQRWFLKAS